jgi:hypothetical protein
MSSRALPHGSSHRDGALIEEGGVSVKKEKGKKEERKEREEKGGKEDIYSNRMAEKEEIYKNLWNSISEAQVLVVYALG